MEKNGDIYLDKYAGWYSVRDEAYYAEDETHLNEQKVRVATKTGTPVEWVEEESYFFQLSAYQDKLLKLYAAAEFRAAEGAAQRGRELRARRPAGSVDLAHHLRLGHPRARQRQAHHVCVGRRADQLHHRRRLPDDQSEKFKRYWPAALHVIGKDIVRFHAVYWPAFLMSAGIEVPQRIFSHGFLFNRGEKMSKSVGNVIDPFALADAYGVDPLRYFFLREVPFGQDGNYSHEAIVNRINADLANDLGNLAQRSLSMIGKAFGGVLPEPGAFSAADKTILAAADAMIGIAREHMKTQQLHQVLNAVWAVVADANRYFASEAPWALAKTDPKRQGTVLYVTAEVLRRSRSWLSLSCRPRPRSLLESSGYFARRNGTSPSLNGATTHRSPAPQSAGARAGVPALCRARRQRPDDAGRQPLPPGFSRLCQRARRRRCARARRRHRPHGHDLDPRAEAPASAGHRREISGRFLLGRHPSASRRMRNWTSTPRALIALTKHPKVVAIGEAGLDYHYDNSPREAQAQGLRQHIAAARETGLPLVIHSRDCDADMARILQEESGKGAFPAVLHCFTGGRDLAFKAIELGLYVSFTGILTFKNSQALRDIARDAAGRPHSGRDRRALSRAAAVSRQTQRAGLCGGNRQGAGADARRFARRDRARRPRRISSACSAKCRAIWLVAA